MLSYSALTGYHTSGHHVEVSETQLREILRLLLGFVTVDEEWYRSANDDVDGAIAAGRFKSAKDHYVNAGYFEDRIPRPITVDEDWYLQIHSDVAEAVRKGTFASAQEHFVSAGFREGRLPHAKWSLLDGSAIQSHRLLQDVGASGRAISSRADFSRSR
jgi:hypothetical protein